MCWATKCPVSFDIYFPLNPKLYRRDVVTDRLDDDWDLHYAACYQCQSSLTKRNHPNKCKIAEKYDKYWVRLHCCC